MEPTEAQYLIVNALEALELLQQQIFDSAAGNWYISTPSLVFPVAMILPSGDISKVNLPVSRVEEVANAQYLVINALETLDLLRQRTFDTDTGDCYIFTSSPVLPIARLLKSGEIVPTNWL